MTRRAGGDNDTPRPHRRPKQIKSLLSERHKQRSNTVKKAFILCIAAAGLFFGGFPALGAMEELNDEALDTVTASGQPTVVISKEGEAKATDNSVQTLNLVENAQVGLRALAITNVVGEAQLIVNLNVASVAGDIAGTDQRNFAVQSWGSTMPKIAKSEEGSPAVVTKQIQPNCEMECKQEIKSGTNVGVTNIASSPVVEIASASGDVIVSGGNGAFFADNNVATLSFEPNAQTDLAALFIANIAGRTQAAFNVNIAASTLNLFPSTDAPFTEPSASSSAVLKQTNSAVQFRGTPINAAASIFVDHTP